MGAVNVEYLPVRSPAELTDHVDLLCDRLEVLWTRWDAGDGQVLDAYRDAAAQLAQAPMRLQGLEPPIDDEAVEEVLRLLVDAGGWVLTGTDGPSLPEDFRQGIAYRREAASQLRAVDHAR